jgi:H/ACA ribonucleoprotein complex subunit 2
MASDTVDKKDKKKVKKEKKEKKVKTRENGVTKSKSDKKEKKEKKDKKKALAQQLEADAGALRPSASNGAVADYEDEDHAMELDITVRELPIGALVPFANPLADEQQTKKLLGVVKKGMFPLLRLCGRLATHSLLCSTAGLSPSVAAQNKTLKRGVKEVVKSLRKSPSTGPSSGAVSDAMGVVIIAADISPMDVISHIPVLCEDHNIPYIYIASRAALGMAGNTKRSTSVVMITKQKGGKSEGAMDADYLANYDELFSLVKKAGATVLR